MQEDELVAELSSLGFLRAASVDRTQQLAAIASRREFAANAVVARQGQVADFIYLVTEGHVALEICAPGTGCRRILTVGAGELLGWSGALGPSEWTATARTLTPAKLIAIEGRRLRELCDADPCFGYEFMTRIAKAIASRLDATRLQLLNLYGTQMADTTGGESLGKPISSS